VLSLLATPAVQSKWLHRLLLALPLALFMALISEWAIGENGTGEHGADATGHSGWRQMIVRLYDQTG
jgi:hypothetical protein